jgi:hypothetical protein
VLLLLLVSPFLVLGFLLLMQHFEAWVFGGDDRPRVRQSTR